MKPGTEVMCLRNAGGRGTILDRATVTGYERREGRRGLVHIRYQDGAEDTIPDDRDCIVTLAEHERFMATIEGRP